MTTIADVRQALADAAAMSGIQVYAYPPDAAVAGSGWVVRREMDPRYIFGETKSNYPMGIVVLFNRAAVQSSMRAIDALCETTGTGSLPAAVQDGTNWAATIDYAQVTRIGEPSVVDIAGAEYLSIEFDIEVVW